MTTQNNDNLSLLQNYSDFLKDINECITPLAKKQNISDNLNYSINFLVIKIILIEDFMKKLGNDPFYEQLIINTKQQILDITPHINTIQDNLVKNDRMNISDPAHDKDIKCIIAAEKEVPSLKRKADDKEPPKTPRAAAKKRAAEEHALREAVEAEKKAATQRESEEQAQREAEEQARREAEKKEADSLREAEEQAQREAERREAEEQAQREAERREAEEQAQREAERREAERREAEERAQREAKQRVIEAEATQKEAEKQAQIYLEKTQREAYEKTPEGIHKLTIERINNNCNTIAAKIHLPVLFIEYFLIINKIRVYINSVNINSELFSSRELQTHINNFKKNFYINLQDSFRCEPDVLVDTKDDIICYWKYKTIIKSFKYYEEFFMNIVNILSLITNYKNFIKYTELLENKNLLEAAKVDTTKLSTDIELIRKDIATYKDNIYSNNIIIIEKIITKIDILNKNIKISKESNTSSNINEYLTNIEKIINTDKTIIIDTINNLNSVLKANKTLNTQYLKDIKLINRIDENNINEIPKNIHIYLNAAHNAVNHAIDKTIDTEISIYFKDNISTESADSRTTSNKLLTLETKNDLFVTLTTDFTLEQTAYETLLKQCEQLKTLEQDNKMQINNIQTELNEIIQPKSIPNTTLTDDYIKKNKPEHILNNKEFILNNTTDINEIYLIINNIIKYLIKKDPNFKNIICYNIEYLEKIFLSSDTLDLKIKTFMFDKTINSLKFTELYTIEYSTFITDITTEINKILTKKKSIQNTDVLSLNDFVKNSTDTEVKESKKKINEKIINTNSNIYNIIKDIILSNTLNKPILTDTFVINNDLDNLWIIITLIQILIKDNKIYFFRLMIYILYCKHYNDNCVNYELTYVKRSEPYTKLNDDVILNYTNAPLIINDQESIDLYIKHKTIFLFRPIYRYELFKDKHNTDIDFTNISFNDIKAKKSIIPDTQEDIIDIKDGIDINSQLSLIKKYIEGPYIEFHNTENLSKVLTAYNKRYPKSIIRTVKNLNIIRRNYIFYLYKYISNIEIIDINAWNKYNELKIDYTQYKYYLNYLFYLINLYCFKLDKTPDTIQKTITTKYTINELIYDWPDINPDIKNLDNNLDNYLLIYTINSLRCNKVNCDDGNNNIPTYFMSASNYEKDSNLNVMNILLRKLQKGLLLKNTKSPSLTQAQFSNIDPHDKVTKTVTVEKIFNTSIANQAKPLANNTAAKTPPGKAIAPATATTTKAAIEAAEAVTSTKAVAAAKAAEAIASTKAVAPVKSVDATPTKVVTVVEAEAAVVVARAAKAVTTDALKKATAEVGKKATLSRAAAADADRRYKEVKELEKIKEAKTKAAEVAEADKKTKTEAANQAKTNAQKNNTAPALKLATTEASRKVAEAKTANDIYDKATKAATKAAETAAQATEAATEATNTAALAAEDDTNAGNKVKEAVRKVSEANATKAKPKASRLKYLSLLNTINHKY